MKKRVLSVFLALLVAVILCGCAEKDIGRDMEDIEAHLSFYSNDSSDLYDNHDPKRTVIMHHSEENRQMDAWYSFVDNTRKGHTASVDVVMLTDEGDPIIYYLHYNGSDYLLVTDTTRDRFGTPLITEDKFAKLLEFTDKAENGRESYHAILTNTDLASLEEYNSVVTELMEQYAAGTIDMEAEYQPFPFELVVSTVADS